MPDLLERLKSALADRYAIESEIGRGGMATVYLAEDLKHHRKVAIKVLHPELSAVVGPDRFLREIEAVAGLTHPHVLPLYDSGEADGLLFYIMPYVEGESLRQRLRREKQLPVDDAIRIAQEVADALDHAHRRGLIHRDIKPGNILLEEGHAVVTDFGVARAITEAGGEKVTATGLAVGTPTYMSPEQAAGESADDRSDVYALGCVLYEMLAGEPPYSGATPQAIQARRIAEAPTPLPLIRETVPDALDAIVMRALSRVPADRFATAQQYGDALRTVFAMPVAERVTRGQSRWLVQRKRFVRALGAAILVVVAALYILTKGRETVIPSEEATLAAGPGIAVLPFTVAGSELEEWREGLVSLLSTGLDGAGGLRAIGSRTVLARWEEMTRDSNSIDHATSLTVARNTGASYALLGSAVAIGPEVRLVADVYEVENGARLGQGQVEGAPDSVLALVDRLSVKVLALILRKGEGELPPVDLASVTTTSVPALKAYLEGEVLFRRAQFDGAIEAYTRAIAADSTFALAHYHLASAYAWHYNIQSPLARRHREAALRLVERLPEREAALVRARHATGEQKAVAVEWLEEAVRIHPDDSEAWFLLGDAHLHTSALTGPEEADRAFRQAVELDPRFVSYQPHAVELAFNLHADSTMARERLEQYERIASGSDYARVFRLAFVLAFGTADDRETALDTADIELLASTQSTLQHPRHWDVRERVLLATRERGSDWRRTAAADLVVRGSLWKRGRLRQALEYLDHPSAPAVSRVCLPAVARGWGIPIPQEVLEEALSLDPEEGLIDFILTCRGYIAADLARWDVHASTLRAVQELGSRAREAGDSVRPRRVEAAASELRGYALWRRGDPGAALPLLEEARRESWYLGDWPGLFYRKTYWYKNLWPAHVHVELGQPGKAEPYFRSMWYHPLSSYHRGQIHQTLGQMEKAREAYEYFVEAWAEADPELQPMVEDARRRLQTLAQ